MYLDIRKSKTGKVTYRFTYMDHATGKRVRFPQEKVPPFKSKEEAQAWADSQAAIMESKKAYIAKKQAWRTHFYDFEELVVIFVKWKKKAAPNSWQSAEGYIRNWVYPFFLDEKKLGNINDWYLVFQEFLDWLTDESASWKKQERTALAASTVNNIVKALNTFLTCMGLYGKMDREISVLKCPTLGDHLLNRRSFADVIPEEEMMAVYNQMLSLHKPAAEFFFVLWHTGMRWNELFSLPITSLFKGDIPNQQFREELARHELTGPGYIYLESQAVYDWRKREEDGTILRKPLKGCKEMHPRFSRTIPIYKKEVWNILALRYKQGLEDFAAKKFGKVKENYMLFEDLEWNKAQLTLKKAYESFGKKFVLKSYHCCRHSFTTLLVGKTKSFYLVRAITGHRKDKSFERYLHIYEQMGVEAKRNAQEIDVI